MTDLPCPRQHWSRFSVLLDHAMDLPEEMRDSWLGALDGDDADLRPWLARVLGSAASVSTGDFLAGRHMPPDEAADFQPGDLIGPYRLVALLGEGGMGRVWRAARTDDGPARDIALKLPHAELLAGPFRARFRRERDVLAGLTHPNIAALYDAGISAEGHPYLALELVQGQTITQHCRRSGASLERRIDLLLQMLAALGYAHAHLIVHRDIKPSNVLVTPEGQVKLLDFGIAKLLDASDSDAQKLTQPASRLATPGYAPPEQMEGGPITVSADLFAAGVLLFELCTGHHPPRQRRDAEALPLASSRADAAAAHIPDGLGLSRRLRGDLDAVIAKATSIDPAQRYISADAFARDLRRWQEGLPVSARRIGPMAQAGKFIRRNRAGVALAALLLLALIGGTAGVAWQAQRAEREAARATAIKDFLIGLFKTEPGANGKRIEAMTAREVLDAGADRADAAFGKHPETEIELLETLANIYDWADEPARATQMWSRRLDLATKLYGPADPLVIDATMTLSNSYLMFLDEDRAQLLLERIRGLVFNTYGPATLERAGWLQARARSLRATHGARAEALADSEAAVAIFATYFPKAAHYRDALEDLADYQYDSEQYAKSLATLETMRAHDMARHEFDATDEMVYYNESAGRIERLGRLDEALARYRVAEAAAERLFGKQSLWYLHAVYAHAQLLHMRGEHVLADQMFLAALGVGQSRAALTGQSTSVLRAYGAALAREGRGAEAVPILEQALAKTQAHGRDEQNLRRTQGMLGDAYDLVGRTAEARALLQTARDSWIRYGPVGGTGELSARERWARFLLDHGERDAAFAEFTAVVREAQGTKLAAVALAEAGLGRLALAKGAIAQADSATATAIQVLDGITMEMDVRARIEVWLARAESLAAGGKMEEARDFAARAQAGAKSWDAPSSPRLARATALAEKFAATQ